MAALRRGTALAELGQAVAHASSLRIARFPTSNEFGDWDTVHNTFSSCNALHQALRRAPSPELARGLFHAAMQIYLDRFLNVPPARLPDEEQPGAAPPDGAEAPAALLELLDREQQVTPAGRLVDAYLRSGRDERPILESLGRAVLREDAGFHDYQELEGALRQYGALRGRPSSGCSPRARRPGALRGGALPDVPRAPPDATRSRCASSAARSCSSPRSRKPSSTGARLRRLGAGSGVPDLRPSAIVWAVGGEPRGAHDTTRIEDAAGGR